MALGEAYLGHVLCHLMTKGLCIVDFLRILVTVLVDCLPPFPVSNSGKYERFLVFFGREGFIPPDEQDNIRWSPVYVDTMCY